MTETLAQAQDWLRQRVDDGASCPCCTQFAKVYRNKIDHHMARTLISMWHTAALDYVHTPSLPGDTHKASQLSWWGLVEEERSRRADGGRVGWWRLTAKGHSFVLGEIVVPKYARVFDSRVMGHDGDAVHITDALGTKFDYAQLMAGI